MANSEECSPFSLIDEHALPFPETPPDPRGGDSDTLGITREHDLNEDSREKDEQLRNETLKDRQQDRAQRKEFAGKIYWLVAFWLGGVGVILLLSGWQHSAWFPYCRPFQLSDGVLMTLIGGTSASVIGLMVIVANYLFPKNGKK